MPTLETAKSRLDLLIRKSRVHLYKPIQIAEILYHHRMNPIFDILNLESYRNPSKAWRNQISRHLVGRVSTSSARFQDNVFEDNAMPPDYLAELVNENESSASPGIVEAYIYAQLGLRLGLLANVKAYLEEATPQTFELEQLIRLFQYEKGLRRSIDKCYEIVVYALFDTLVQALEAKVSLSVPDENLEILRDFEDFTTKVLGISAERREVSCLARLYRVGVTNAADRGLDMWANFGPAVQVRHVSLSGELVSGISSEVAANAKIVIVCQDAEQSLITHILSQSGFGSRIQGVITQSDLEKWYKKSFSTDYIELLGKPLLGQLIEEFDYEFPSTGATLADFKAERGYNQLSLTGIWTM